MNAANPDAERQAVVKQINTTVESEKFCSTWTISGDLRGAFDDVENSMAWPVICALEYRLEIEGRTNWQDKWGPYAPFRETDEICEPPPPAELGETALARLAGLVSDNLDPTVRGRIADVLWVAKYGTSPHLFAKEAIRAWIAAAKSPGHWGLDWLDHLIRAGDLALETNNKESFAQVTTTMMELTDTFLDAEDPAPGITVPLLSYVSSHPESVDNDALLALLDRSLDVYSTDVWTTQSITDIYTPLLKSEPARIDELRQQVLDRWTTFAEAGNPLFKFMQLHKAAEIATSYGLTPERNKILASIQELGELPLQTVEVTNEIPEAVFEWHERLRDAKTVQDFVKIFLALGPPTGDLKNNQETAAHVRDTSALAALFPPVVIGPNNSIIYAPTDEDGANEHGLIEQEAQMLNAFGHFLTVGLRIGKPLLGDLDDKELTALFGGTINEAPLDEQFGRALRRYLNNDLEPAAYLLAPRLERSVRNLCQRIGIPIIRMPEGQKRGGVRQLGDLLSALDGLMDESWRRYYRHLLCDPLGRNLRNRIGHGLMDAVSEIDVALMIHCALTFSRLWSISDSDD